MKIFPHDFVSKLKVIIDVDKSVPIPKTPTEVIETENGWIFPEGIVLYNDNEKYLYAFGFHHTWRSSGEGWELLK